MLFYECIEIPTVQVDSSAYSHDRQFLLKDQLLHSLFAAAQIHGGLFNSQESRLRVFVRQLLKLFLDDMPNFRRYDPGQYLNHRIGNTVLTLECCAIQRRNTPPRSLLTKPVNSMKLSRLNSASGNPLAERLVGTEPDDRQSQRIDREFIVFNVFAENVRDCCRPVFALHFAVVGGIGKHFFELNARRIWGLPQVSLRRALRERTGSRQAQSQSSWRPWRPFL